MRAGRVQIENGTVVGARSEILRGGVAWIYKYGQQDDSTAYAHDPAYYEQLRGAGLNAVRLVCFDPWQRTHGYPHYDFTDAGEMQRFLSSLDKAVELARRAGLYTLINYHDVGRCDRQFARAFWQSVAPRYASRPDVFYELANEPVQWFPEDYSEDVMALQGELYRLVRAHAPDTHLVLLSFANLVGSVPECTMESVAARLEGVDWTNASVGFHPYRTHGSSAAIESLRRHYAVINTEQNLPNSHGGVDFIQPMDGHEWGAQTMETLGVSWFAWDVEGPEKFQKNLVEGFLADAKRKDYEWNLPRRRRKVGSASRAWQRVAGLPVRQWNRAMGFRWRHAAGLIGLNVAATLLDVFMLALLFPILQGAVTGSFGWLDGWSRASRTDTLLILAGVAFLAGVAKNGVLYAAHMINARLYSRYSRNLAIHAFERFLAYGKSYFDGRETGQLTALIERHHDVLNLYQPVWRTIAVTVLLVGHFSVMLWISWRMTLVAVLLLPVLTLASRWMVARSTVAAEAIRRDEAELGHSVWQMLGALPLFRSFGREAEVLEQFRRITSKRRENAHRLWRAQGLSARVLDIAVQGSVLAMLAVAFVLEQHGPADTMRLLVFFFVARVAVPEVAKYHDLLLSFTEHLPGAREFATLFDDRGKYLVPEGTKQLGGLSSGIEFRSLHFQYPGGPAAISQVSFRMEKGTVTALVGPSGAGKSTLTHLLVRFYDVPPGSILIDGVDIREYTFGSVRQQVSIVSQDVLLLNRSLRDNLAFGAEGTVSDQVLLNAAADAQLDDVIASLPDGLDTPLGEHGSRLSGGQRQRVAIARALVKSAPILILDEATSALDSLTEARLQQAIGRVVHGCTSLVIAHRLSTIRRADRIVVMEGGRIVEQGTLDELIKRRGLFHQMWEEQTFQ